MKIPDSIIVITGEQEEAHRTIEKFFEETITEIKKRVRIPNGPSRFELKVSNLCELNPSPPKSSDDYVHMLFYERRVVAAVFETRTEYNYIQFDYFQNLSNI